MKKPIYILIIALFFFIFKVNAATITLQGPNVVQITSSFYYGYNADVLLGIGQQIDSYEWSFIPSTGKINMSNNSYYSHMSSFTHDVISAKFLNTNGASTTTLTVTVSYHDAKQSYTATSSITIKIYAICSSAQIIGNNIIGKCLQTSNVYQVINYCNCQYWDNICDNIKFNWSIPSGWSFIGSSTTSSVTIKPDMYTSGTIKCIITRPGTADSRTVSINVSRSNPNEIILGSDFICGNTTQNYSVNSPCPLNGYFIWELTGGFKFNNESGGQTLTTTSTNVTVYAPNSYGQGTIKVKNGSNGNLYHEINKNITRFVNTVLSQPGSVNFVQAGSTCYFKAVVPAVTGATSYLWSDNVYPGVWFETPTPYYNGLYEPNTSYTIYVKAKNPCAISSQRVTTKKTPTQPSGCQRTQSNDDIFSYISPEESGVQNNINLLSINNPDQENIAILYPNPNNGLFIIDLVGSIENNKVIITDIFGKQVFQKEFHSNKLEVNLTEQPKGIYSIKIISNNNIYTKNIIIH